MDAVALQVQGAYSRGGRAAAAVVGHCPEVLATPHRGGWLVHGLLRHLLAAFLAGR